MSGANSLIFERRGDGVPGREGASASCLQLPCALPRLESEARIQNGEVGVAILHANLAELAQKKELIITAADADGVAYVPYTKEQYFRTLSDSVDEGVLSRFTLIRAGLGEGIVVESPFAEGHIEIGNKDVAAAVAGLLVGDRCLRRAPSAPASFAFALRLLTTGGFTEHQASADVVAPALWEFHDLYFHTRSRLGKHGNESGATFRLADHGGPAPAYKPQAGGGVLLQLPRPNEAHTMSLGDVMARRKSLRSPGAQPLTFDELAHFLFSVARSDGQWSTDIGEFTKRPYPSGGGSYELEIYVLANRVAGLSRSVYHYDPAGHALRELPTDVHRFDEQLHDAFRACAGSGVPDALFVVASRIRRLAWKYSAIAYATTLKNVGVLYGMMYLVATALHLRPCALGLGNADNFAKLVGADFYSECAVGEFMLSGRT